MVGLHAQHDPPQSRSAGDCAIVTTDLSPRTAIPE
jgi:hypothetical protein